jgi:hypothetical protein
MNESGRSRSARAGFVALLGVVSLALLTLLLGTVLALAMREQRQIKVEERQIQAAWLAEAGAERARIRLGLDPNYTGETWVLSAEDLGSHGARVEIRVVPASDAPESLSLLVRADFPASGPGRTRVSRHFTLTQSTPRQHEESP